MDHEIRVGNFRSKEKSIVSSFVKEKEDAEEVEHFVNDDIKIERILKPRVTIDSKSKSSSPIRMNISERVNMSLQIKPQVAAQQYCLRWKYHHSNLQVMFIQLLQRESFCDVTLACEGKMLRAHKVGSCRAEDFGLGSTCLWCCHSKILSPKNSC